MVLDQLKESRQIRGEGQLQTGEFQIGSISDLGAVVLRSLRLATTPTAVGTTLDLRDGFSFARRTIEGQRHVSER